jgi:hypothetical protein
MGASHKIAKTNMTTQQRITRGMKLAPTKSDTERDQIANTKMMRSETPPANLKPRLPEATSGTIPMPAKAVNIHLKNLLSFPPTKRSTSKKDPKPAILASIPTIANMLAIMVASFGSAGGPDHTRYR